MKLPIRLPKINLPLPFLKKKGSDEDAESEELDGAVDGGVEADPAEQIEAFEAAVEDTVDASGGEADGAGPAGKLDRLKGLINLDKLKGLKLPKLRLKGASEGAVVESSTGAEQSGSLKRRLGLIGGAVIGLLVVGLAGAIAGWLGVNADSTVEGRAERRPTLSVKLLPPGQEAPKNSSAGEAGMETDPDALRKAEEEAARQAEEEAKLEAQRRVYNPDLVEDTDRGPLPVMAADGRMPLTEYAHPFNTNDKRPRVAIVMTQLGLSPKITKAAIELLPSKVALSFSSMGKDMEEWVEMARKDGHELLVDVPMEPINFPVNDPGPYTLLTSLNEVENLNRLEWSLSRLVGYVGVVSNRGSQFTTNEEALGPILDAIKERGLMFIDSRETSRSIATELATSLQLPRAFNNLAIDPDPAAAAIDRRLAELERVALDRGASLGLAQPYPVTIDRLTAWIAGLEAKGIVLAPVTAVADRQSVR